jgi:cytochrome c-type biogenesis protein CcmH
MTLWFALAMMTAAAMFAVLWPLGRRYAGLGEGADVAVYRDQLEEVERDHNAGLLGAPEAEAARVEIARRLLAASDAGAARTGAAGSVIWRRRVVAAAVLVLLPVGAAALYVRLGSPALPDVPLAERAATPADQRSIASLVAQVEAHLEKNPNDGHGWEVLAPVYLRLGRYDDAVRAWRNTLRLNGENAAREADYGEALVAAGNGVVTAEAKSAFERSQKLDGEEPKSRYFLGLAAEQDGKPKEAAAIWRALLAGAGPNAPWADGVRQALARVDPAAASAPAPSAADITSAEKLSPAQRSAMISGMVSRLAERLKQDGGDIEGWQRLIRAYMVLGERDKAKDALAAARKANTADPEKLRRIEELTDALGLKS